MEFIGKFRDVSRDLFSGNCQMVFDANDINLEDINAIKDEEELRITVKKYRRKRSLDANAYYWQLLSKVAETLQMSKPHCHNLMLARYGQTEFFGDQVAYTMLPDTEVVTKRMEQMQEAHFAPTSQRKMGTDGIIYRAWKLLKPSHEYDSKEMSVLIEGIVSEAKELGIETLPPVELERMMQALEKRDI